MCRNLVTMLGLPNSRRSRAGWGALLLLAACFGAEGLPRAQAANPFKKSAPAATPSATQGTGAKPATGAGGKPVVDSEKKVDLIA